ncbi:MAG: hypothetical protein IAC78_01480 [Firmicutes bacterium]|uniref:Uncharacterized protein n=1 Tax=Candidatus Scatoplasma merdavium TaxID=2840932 RepID=A0A9D9D5N7_9BACL|nr:hypothetical protein [Candidatus Scatoplasma merdavium]
MAKKETNFIGQEEDVAELDSSLTQTTFNKNDTEVADKISMGYFHLLFRRIVIKVKNRIALIPMLMTVFTMCVITFTIFIRVRAISVLTVSTENYPLLPNYIGDWNAMFHFFTCLLAILSCVIYLNSIGRHASKEKKYIFLGLFVVAMAIQIVFDVLFLNDVDMKFDLGFVTDRVDDTYGFNLIATSVYWCRFHLICAAISIGLAIIEPFLQPFVKKIQLR